MKSVIISVLGLFLVGSFLGCGDGYSLVPVSGTVTVNGKPEGGIKLYFAPVATEGSVTAGPHSTGITDDNGDFVLENRNGKPGAVTGNHRVIVSYADAASGKTLTTPSVEKAKKRRLDMMRAKNVQPKTTQRERRPSRITIDVTVPSGGTETLKIELNTK